MIENGSNESSISVNRKCIEESIDLNEPYLSVTERYYTPYYKIDQDRARKNDLCLLIHSNRISLITLAPSHPILSTTEKISVNCEVSGKVDRKQNKAVGKSKKGGQNLEPTSIVCFLEVSILNLFFLLLKLTISNITPPPPYFQGSEGVNIIQKIAIFLNLGWRDKVSY